MDKKIINHCNKNDNNCMESANLQDIRINQESTLNCKAAAALLTLIQFITSTIQVLDISLNLIFKIHLFIHYEILISMFTLWTLSMIWLIFTVLMFAGIIFNNDILILSFILFNIIFTFISFGLLILLIVEKSYIYSIFYLLFIFIVVLLTINYSWSFFNKLCNENII
uniref:MARVEL domain-containing protein n=1 Tax=Strongyloides stercoralis TaxID=6248 RepID=A0A0K0ENC4_STRER